MPVGRARSNHSEEVPTGLYSREEALLIYAALREEPGRRSLDPIRILELSELLGRSPGSISLKVAGYRALEGGDSPQTRRVSWVQRAVRLDFEGDTNGLLEEAARARRRMLPTLASARFEWDSPMPGAPGLPDRFIALVEATGFPSKGFQHYSHTRGQFQGVALSSVEVLAGPRAAMKFAQQLSTSPGPGNRMSVGFSRVRRGATGQFARGILSWKFPTLHLRELPRPLLVRLGGEVANPSIHGFVVSPRIAETVAGEERIEFRRGIRRTLGLDPTLLCPTCLVLLGYLAGQIERKGTAPDHPSTGGP